MALGDRWRSWWSGDDDDSAFSDDVWDTLGVDKSPDDDSWWDSVGTTITPAEEDPYLGIGSYFDTFDYGDQGDPTVDFEDPNFNWGEFDVDSYLDDLLNFDSDYSDDPRGLGEGYGDAFNFGSLDDDDNTAFNEFISNFDFDDPKADWAGGIGDLFGYGGLWAEGDDPNDRFDIGAGYDDAFGDIFGGDTKDPEYSILENLLFGQKYGGTGGAGNGTGGADTGGIFSGKRMPKAANFFNSLFGGAKDVGSKLESGIGGLLDSNLGKLLLANYLTKKDEGPAGVVPVGADAFSAVGGDGGGGSPIDYRVMNLQPALMPGVAYANVGNDEPSIPPGMKGGGLGDITLARLEPGEFVVTKKAVDNIGAKNLYKMMKQAEGRG